MVSLLVKIGGLDGEDDDDDDGSPLVIAAISAEEQTINGSLNVEEALGEGEGEGDGSLEFATDELKVGQDGGGGGGDGTGPVSQLLDFLNANADNILAGNGNGGTTSDATIHFPSDQDSHDHVTDPSSAQFEDMVLIKATDKTIKASDKPLKATDKTIQS